MKTKINLPASIEVDDYHEFPYLQAHLRKIIPGIKVCEVGCAYKYIGIAYIGSLKNPKAKKMVREIKAACREYQKENWDI